VDRHRDEAARRLDQFVDAAFGFAVTLLVISGGAPTDLDALVEALWRAPAFAMSFCLIALFWLAHRDYARLAATRTAWATALSLAIVFTALVYVFPLRLLSESAFHAFSGGRLPGRDLLSSFEDLRTLYVVYALGFVALGGLFFLLFRTVTPERAASEAALRDARGWRRSMAILLAAGLASAATALLLPMSGFPWVPGTIYGLIPLAIWIGSALDRPRGPAAVPEATA
jgi:uncharacterized membrane protein